MADVILTIGDRTHIVSCQDGSEEQMKRLGVVLGEHWPAARRASGGQNPERTMLFLALLLADALEEAGEAPPSLADPVLLEQIADRLERLATALEE